MRATRSSQEVWLRRLAKRTIGALATTAAGVVLCLPLLVQPTLAQDVNGTIRGAVLDQSGGAIVGAMVTVTDVARGITRTLTTDDAGQYLANNLTPGTYTVRATANGFRNVEHSGVLVQVSENIRVDLVVQPGEQAQTITVSGEVPAVDTTDATLGGAVSNAEINSLPLNGRNFQRLLELRPGVVYVTQGSRSGSSSTNGRRSGGDLLLVEGIPQIDQAYGGSSMNAAYTTTGEDTASILPIDAIQEFATIQNPKAEYGFKDGSIVSVGVKSGTNSLHGTAYAFGRDAAATDAANYFTAQKTPATLEQFGVTAGGPVIKDKVFFFAGFEGLRAVVGSTVVDQVPTDISLATAANPAGNAGASMVDACRAAVAAGKLNALSAQLAGIQNPATCAVSPASPTVENIFPYTQTTVTTSNYAPGTPSTTPLNNGMIKGDWTISPKNHLDGMYFVSKSTQINGSLEPMWDGDIVLDTQSYDGNWTWTPNSTIVNDARVGYAYLDDQTLYGDANLLPSNPWPHGYGLPTGVTNPLFGGLPTIAITGGFTSLGNGSRTGVRGPDGTLDFKDSVSYLRGTHAFKAGFEYADVILDENRYSLAQGSITFPSLLGFLEGTPTNGSILGGNPTSNIRQHWFSGFVQDDWRVARRLTLNLGLRYEYYTSIVERDNYIGNFNPNVNPLTTPAVEQAGPGAPIPSMWQDPPKDLFLPRLGFAWDIRGDGRTVLRGGAGLLTSSPSIPEIRVPFEPFGANFFGGTATAPVLIANNSGTQANAHTPLSFSFTSASQLASLWNTTGPIFPNYLPLVVDGVSYSSESCTVAVPCSTGALPPNFTVPRSGQWNLDLQRVITNNLTLDIAYVGNHGWYEQFLEDINEPAVGSGWDAKAVGACLDSAPKYNTCTVDTANELANRPYNTQFPYLNYIMQSQNGAYSNYDALQVTAEQRLSHGLSFLAGYTYSHALDIYSSVSQGNILPSNPNDLVLDYGNSDNDVRHRVTFSPTYTIPGVKAPGQMLQGWSLNGILILQSGLGWYPDDNNKTDWLGTGEYAEAFSTQVGQYQFWNYSGPTSAFNEGLNPIPCYAGANVAASSSLAKGCLGTLNSAAVGSLAPAPASIVSACTAAATAPYGGASTTEGQLALASLVNSTCYIQNGGVLTPPAYGTLGNAGRGIFRGQPYYNLDFAIAKLWQFHERYSAQFRFETFNLFNRTDWAAPSSTNPTSPTTFGVATTTADNGNAVLGSGGPRHIQFALKLTF